MCKVITILNKKPKDADNKKIINDFLSANADDLHSQADGYSVLRDKNPYYFPPSKKSYDPVNFRNNIEYTGGRVHIVHSRISTGGTIGYKGLHLQKIGRFFYAHNGWTNLAPMDRSDSHWFFKDHLIPSKLEKKDFEDAIDIANFRGKGFLYDTKNDRIHIFCNQELTIVALTESCLAFVTYDPSYEVIDLSRRYILGYPFSETEISGRVIPVGVDIVDNTLLTIDGLELVGMQKLEVVRKVGLHTGRSFGKNYSYAGATAAKSSSRWR